jgi:hypothetical protein
MGGETDARMRANRASRPDEGGDDDMIGRGTPTGGEQNFPGNPIAAAADQAPWHQRIPSEVRPELFHCVR